VRYRLFIEASAAGLIAVLVILTSVEPDWIEATTGLDPDHHNGMAERLIVVLLAAVAVALVFAANRDRRRLKARTLQRTSEASER
jgi:hypothetical protein